MSDLQRQGPLRIIHGQEDKTNEAYGSRCHGGHKSDMDDMIENGRFLDTSDRRGDGHRFYSSSGFDRYHGHHCYHLYWRNNMGYFLDESKKSKPPTFDGDLKMLD